MQLDTMIGYLLASFFRFREARIIKKNAIANISCKAEQLRINCEYGTVIAQCTCKEKRGRQIKK